MNRVRVKICGLTTFQEVYTSIDAGADAVGFVVEVPDSPRNLSLEEAHELMRSVPVFVESVIVAVPKDIQHLNRIYKILRPPVLQIHGSIVSQESIHKRFPNVQVICAVNAGSNDVIVEAKYIAGGCDAILVDSSIQGKHGGTG